MSGSDADSLATDPVSAIYGCCVSDPKKKNNKFMQVCFVPRHTKLQLVGAFNRKARFPPISPACLIRCPVSYLSELITCDTMKHTLALWNALAWGCRLAQLVERTPHVLRLCSGHGLDSWPGSLCCVSLPLFLSPRFLPYLQLTHQLSHKRPKKIIQKKRKERRLPGICRNATAGVFAIKKLHVLILFDAALT